MHRQYAGRLQVAEVETKGFHRQQVDGNGVARERIHGQHVEFLVRLALERKAGVPQDDVELRLAVLEVSEFGPGDGDDERVELVVADAVPGPAVSGQRAGSQS